MKIWRRSFDVLPPALNINDKRSAQKQAMYRNIDSALLPAGESLKTTIERVIPVSYTHLTLPTIYSV